MLSSTVSSNTSPWRLMRVFLARPLAFFLAFFLGDLALATVHQLTWLHYLELTFQHDTLVHLRQDEQFFVTQ